MSRLNLTLFGTPRVEIDNQAVHIPRHKATALLAYLALTGLYWSSRMWMATNVTASSRI